MASLKQTLRIVFEVGFGSEANPGQQGNGSLLGGAGDWDISVPSLAVTHP